MKKAFVSDREGLLELSIIRDARPVMQIVLDLGFTPTFLIELPFPEDEPHNSSTIMNQGIDVLVDQVRVFLNDKGVSEDIIQGMIESLYSSLEGYNPEPDDPLDSDMVNIYEVRIPLTESFLKAVQDHVILNKTAEYVNTAVEFEKKLKEQKLIQNQNQQAKNDALSILNRYRSRTVQDTPGPLYVPLYDQYGKPSGVGRVTNRGVTRFYSSLLAKEQETHKEAYVTSDTMRTRTYWHGTTILGAKKILQSGILSPGISYEDGDLLPQEGRSYFATSIFQALQYAITRDPRAKIIPIFAIQGSAFNDVTLDEDFILNLLECEFKEEVHSLDGYTLCPLLSKEDFSSPVVKKLESFVINKVGPKWVKADSSLRTSLLKDIITELPEDLFYELIHSFPASVTSDGVVWPSQLYVIKHDDFERIQATPSGVHQFWKESEVTVLDPRDGVKPFLGLLNPNKNTVKTAEEHSDVTPKLVHQINDAFDYKALKLKRDGEKGVPSNLFDAVQHLRDETGLPLKQLGAGSSRIVFELSKNTVLKIGINTAGIAQNKQEYEAYEKLENCSLIARVFWYDPEFRWLISEKAVPAKSSDFRIYGHASPMRFISDYLNPDGDHKDKEAWKSLQVLNKALDLTDAYDLSQWGVVTRRGQRYPVLVDYGFSPSVGKKFYTAKMSLFNRDTFNFGTYEHTNVGKTPSYDLDLEDEDKALFLESPNLRSKEAILHTPPPALIHYMKTHSPSITEWYKIVNGSQLEKEFNLPEKILMYLMEIESKGDPLAKSRSGAEGLFQITPSSGIKVNPYDPPHAAHEAAKLLGHYFKRFGNLEKALAAYNWGGANLAQKGLESIPLETKKYLEFFRQNGFFDDPNSWGEEDVAHQNGK